MSQYNETGLKNFTAGAAIAMHTIVKLSSNKLAAAGVGDRPIGTLEEASTADGDVRTVRLWNVPGTRKMIASGAISLHALVYLAADGKVTATSGGDMIGIALEAATTSGGGDIIEVYPLTGELTPIANIAALTENSSAIGGTNDGNLPALVDPAGDAGVSLIAGVRENSAKINALIAAIKAAGYMATA